MLSLNDLPVELVIKIMRGASLTDILNVTRTSTFLRSVGFSSRLLWKNAKDADRLPLPMGETLDTFPLLAIGKLAAYAIALSALWRKRTVHPRRVTHVGPCPSQPRSRSVLVSPHAAILPGNKWLLIDMDTDSPHLYCPANGEFLPLGVDGRVVSYAYESQTNGASVIVALIRVRWRGEQNIIDKEQFIDVYVIQFDPKFHCRRIPSINRALSIRLPHERCLLEIDLKGPLVVVSGEQELFIANWQERSGINLLPPPTNDPDGETNDENVFTLKASMHPNIPLLLAEKRTRMGNDDSIHVINFPAKLPPFEDSDLTDKKMTWPKDSFKTTCLHTLGLLQIPQYRGFRYDPGGSLSFDIACVGEHPHTITYLSVSELDSMIPEVSCRKVPIDPHKQVRQVRTSSGNPLCFWRSRSYGETPAKEWAFLRRPGDGDEIGPWVGLEVPEDVTLESIDPEVLSFDDVYGTLLLHEPLGNYCIVQY